jgi:hypothetical protein
MDKKMIGILRRIQSWRALTAESGTSCLQLQGRRISKPRYRHEESRKAGTFTEVTENSIASVSRVTD